MKNPKFICDTVNHVMQTGIELTRNEAINALTEGALYYRNDNSVDAGYALQQLIDTKDLLGEAAMAITKGEVKAIINSVYKVVDEFQSTTPLSELYLGEMLTHSIQDKYKFCSYLGKHLQWDGRTWSECDKNQLEKIAAHIIKEQHTKSVKKKNQAFYEKNMKLSTFRNMVGIANSHIGVNLLDFDKHKTHINMLNGIFDIKKKSLLMHDPKYLMTKTCNIAYDKDALCENWELFLDMIFEGNTELIRFIQKALGYCLTAETGIPAFFVCYGTGANGKSTFMNTIHHVLGEYYNKLPAKSLMEKPNDDIPHDIAGLRGARFVSTSETKVGRPLDEARIKELTGERTIQVRQLYKEYFSMEITFKLWLMSNNKPSIKSVDEGTWRRINLIPFKYCIPEEKRVVDYEQKYLYDEAPGIFNWMVDGYHMLMEEGFTQPDIVKIATKEYRNEEDFIGDWIDEHCETGDYLSIRTTELYNHFKSTSGSKMGKKRLVTYLKQQGFDYEKGAHNFNYWKGISKKEDWDYGEDQIY